MKVLCKLLQGFEQRNGSLCPLNWGPAADKAVQAGDSQARPWEIVKFKVMSHPSCKYPGSLRSWRGSCKPPR